MPLSRLLPVALLLSLAACRHVRQEDLDAWRGAPVEALETHSEFASMQLTKRPLSSGGELWNFQNCGTTPGAVIQGQYGPIIIPAKTACCSNQFIISAAGKVEEYRPIGKCYTNADLQPQASR